MVDDDGGDGGEVRRKKKQRESGGWIFTGRFCKSISAVERAIEHI
jgi:hypothetical protein